MLVIVSYVEIVASDPMDSTLLIINSELHLPQSEVQYRFARSGGPGGQHVKEFESHEHMQFVFNRADDPI